MPHADRPDGPNEVAGPSSPASAPTRVKTEDGYWSAQYLLPVETMPITLPPATSGPPESPAQMLSLVPAPGAWPGRAGEGTEVIELAEMIEQLRRELTTAMAAGQDEELRFALGPVELEAAVVVERSGTAGTKIRFWVVEAAADGRKAATTTHRVTLTLEPRTREGNQRPWVSGAETDRER